MIHHRFAAVMSFQSICGVSHWNFRLCLCPVGLAVIDLARAAFRRGAACPIGSGSFFRPGLGLAGISPISHAGVRTRQLKLNCHGSNEAILETAIFATDYTMP